MIHKRITSTKRCTSFDYQLCSASLRNDTVAPDGEWKKECKVHWRLITCPVCLGMRNNLPARPKWLEDFNKERTRLGQ